MGIIEEQYNLVDKSKWDRGEWDKEPDLVRLREDVTDVWLPAFAWRMDWGHINGYVGVLECSPLWGRHYDKMDIDVHGGLTFVGRYDYLSDNLLAKNIWWFGFDTHHYMDYAPGFPSIPGLPNRMASSNSYKNIQYVINEIQSLCKQLKTIEYEHRNKHRHQGHQGKRNCKPKGTVHLVK